MSKKVLFLLLIVGLIIISGCGKYKGFDSAEKSYNITFNNKTTQLMKSYYNDREKYVNTEWCVLGNANVNKNMYQLIGLIQQPKCSSIAKFKVSSECKINLQEENDLRTGQPRLLVIQCDNNKVVIYDKKDTSKGYYYEI